MSGSKISYVRILLDYIDTSKFLMKKEELAFLKNIDINIHKSTGLILVILYELYIYC